MKLRPILAALAALLITLATLLSMAQPASATECTANPCSGTIEAAGSNLTMSFAGGVTFPQDASNLGLGGIGFQFDSSWTGTIAFQGRVSGSSDWIALNMCKVSDSSPATSTTATDTAFIANIAGLREVRAVTVAGTTGAASVTIFATSTPGGTCSASFSGSGLALESGGNLDDIAANTLSIKELLETTATQLSGTSTMTDTSADDIIPAQGSGFGIAVMACLVTNKDATVGTIVSLRSATTVKWQAYAKEAGGGFMATGGGLPMFVTGDDEALTAINTTDSADVAVSCSGYKVAL